MWFGAKDYDDIRQAALGSNCLFQHHILSLFPCRCLKAWVSQRARPSELELHLLGRTEQLRSATQRLAATRQRVLTSE